MSLKALIDTKPSLVKDALSDTENFHQACFLELPEMVLCRVPARALATHTQVKYFRPLENENL